MIKAQLEKGDKAGLELAAILATRINPLVLGQYESTINIAKEYQKELLLMRMFKSHKEAEERVEAIVKRFSTGYTHHTRIIDYKEAQDIFGKDKIEFLSPHSKEWSLIWRFYTNYRTASDLLGLLKYLEKIKDEEKRK